MQGSFNVTVLWRIKNKTTATLHMKDLGVTLESGGECEIVQDRASWSRDLQDALRTGRAERVGISHLEDPSSMPIPTPALKRSPPKSLQSPREISLPPTVDPTTEMVAALKVNNDLLTKVVDLLSRPQAVPTRFVPDSAPTYAQDRIPCPREEDHAVFIPNFKIDESKISVEGDIAREESANAEASKDASAALKRLKAKNKKA